MSRVAKRPFPSERSYLAWVVRTYHVGRMMYRYGILLTWYTWRCGLVIYGGVTWSVWWTDVVLLFRYVLVAFWWGVIGGF